MSHSERLFLLTTFIFFASCGDGFLATPCADIELGTDFSELQEVSCSVSTGMVIKGDNCQDELDDFRDGFESKCVNASMKGSPYYTNHGILVENCSSFTQGHYNCIVEVDEDNKVTCVSELCED